MAITRASLVPYGYHRRMSGFDSYSDYDALGLAELIRKREVSSSELVEVCIARIEQLNPQVNAVVNTMYDAARALLGRFDHLERGVRLTGVSASGLTDDPATPLFVDPAREKRERLEAVSAELRARFGERAIERARLVDQRPARGFEGVSREMVPVRRDPDEP